MSSAIVCTSEPPVASIGSITITGRPASDSGSLLTYGLGLERLLVAGDADETDVGDRHQFLGGVHEPEPGSQHRDDHRLHGQPSGRGRRERCLDRALDRRQRLGRLGEQQRADPFEVGAEQRVRRVAVADPGERVGDERVIDEGDGRRACQMAPMR